MFAPFLKPLLSCGWNVIFHLKQRATAMGIYELSERWLLKVNDVVSL